MNPMRLVEQGHAPALRIRCTVNYNLSIHTTLADWKKLGYNEENHTGEIAMILYITSSPCIDGADRAILNPENGFIIRLKADLPPCPRCLFIASSPDTHELTCHFGSHMFIAFAEAGIPFSSYTVLDAQNAGEAAELIELTGYRSDSLILTYES